MAQVIRFLGHFQTIKLTDSIFFSENKYFFSQFGLPNKQASHWIETGPVQLFGRPEQLVDIVSEIVTLFKSPVHLAQDFAVDFVVVIFFKRKKIASGSLILSVYFFFKNLM